MNSRSLQQHLSWVTGLWECQNVKCRFFFFFNSQDTLAVFVSFVSLYLLLPSEPYVWAMLILLDPRWLWLLGGFVRTRR